MIEWTDVGIVLASRRHGENAAIVSLLTQSHGRQVGLVPGGAGRRARGLYEPGNRVQATWRARLSEHLGHFACELLESRAARLLDDATRLAALTSAAAVLEAALPEREPHRRLYDRLDGLVENLCDAVADRSWPALYVRFELELLAELGFGLDLSRCAATGQCDDLAYVSPKTGRAVSAAAGAPYRDRLLALPAFLRNDSVADLPVGAAEIQAGLALTGFFLDRHVLSHRAAQGAGQRSLPAARERLVSRLRSAA